MTNDLPVRLRQEVAIEPETQRLLWEAAAEIERLRGSTEERLFCEQTVAGSTPAAGFALTDAEREALHHVVGDVADITGPVEDTIRGLLERTK